MLFTFSAIIYKTGINLCVDVPLKITQRMKPVKGYIPVKGTIEGHGFTQTLVPVKHSAYRLFVNGPMLKRSRAKLGDKVKFSIEQDEGDRTEPFPPMLKKALSKHKLLPAFEKLPASRQKEVFRYLNHLKAEASLERNIAKVIAQLQADPETSTTEKKGFLRNL
jgi:hypothetical protein